jgi:hypothetical protein
VVRQPFWAVALETGDDVLDALLNVLSAHF